MPTVRDQAIPIRLWDYSETSQTACLFCKEFGIVRGLAKGAKREKSRFSGGLEMLTRGEIVAIVRPTADLANLIEWDLQHIYRAARDSLTAHNAALYMTDLVYHAVTDHDPHPALFDRLDAELDALHEGTGIPFALVRFQWALLAETGYQPRLDAAPDPPRGTLAFDPERGSIVPDPGPGASASLWRVRPQTVALLRTIEQSRPLKDTHHTDHPHREVAIRAGRLLAAYLRHILRRDLPTRVLAFPSDSQSTKSTGLGD